MSGSPNSELHIESASHWPVVAIVYEQEIRETYQTALNPNTMSNLSKTYATKNIPSALDPSAFLLFTNGGKQARAALEAVLALNDANRPRIRVTVHSDPSAASLRAAFPALDPASILVGDTRELSFQRTALAGGVTHVYHVGREFTPSEAVHAIDWIDNAKATGTIRFFVYVGALHPFRRKMINHRIKLDVEEYLAEARLPYCVLQPADHMQNHDVKKAVETGELIQYYSVDELEAFFDIKDLGEVSVKVLKSPGEHNLARYELFGYAHTYREAAEILSRVAGKPVKARKVERKEALVMCTERAKSRGENEYYANGFAMMIAYNDRFGLLGNSNVLKWLLGREPTTWEEFCKRILA
ncbi:hypothetical protein EV714DRAFT_241665 [Schizophyllum commune]